MRLLSGLLMAGVLCAQTPLFPLRDVRPGMRGTGKTVFSGGHIEEFQVEILGVLDNVGPKQSLILARLSGGPLAETGVMQGMSGSPVYLDGRLAGAVAMGFPFSKQPICGIRPIEDMLRIGQAAPAPRRAAAKPGVSLEALAPADDVLAAGGRMVDIATPVSFGGFTRTAIEHFAPQLRALGLEPRQGMTGGSAPPARLGNPASLEPGAMISVQLLSGDLAVGAEGTVTYIDGQNIYAFGHRFLSVGATELPFARADVLTVLPNLSSSFKISAAREWLGTITQDRSTAVAGELGRLPRGIPLQLTVKRSGDSTRTSYAMNMVRDSILSPFLLQAAVFSVIDATERAVGDSTFAVTGKVEFENGAMPLQLNNMYAGDFNVPAQVSVATAVPLAYVMQSGFSVLNPKSVALEIESFPQKRQLQIDQLWASRRQVRPGESVDLTLILAGDDGVELTRKLTYRVPIGAALGPLQFTATDANTMNVTEFRQLLAAPPKSAAQLISFMNSLRINTNAYLRVWRAEPTFDVQGENLPDPPPSVALILGRTQASLNAAPAPANAKLAELSVSAGDMVVAGTKTVQVEIKE